MNVLLITDLDNTLYNWIDYFGMSFRGMAHAMSREMKIDELEFIDGARQVYKKAGTLDYGFLIQELPFISRYSDAEVARFVELSKTVFSIVRSKNLVPYEGVARTFEYLNSIGVKIVAVTNAPIYFGESRLKQLRLDKYILGILGWEGQEIPDSPLTQEIRKRYKERRYESGYILKRWAEPYENLKPNPIGYLKVLQELLVSHKNTYIVGDSLEKDIRPANEIGATSIWAKYGTAFEEKNFQTLLMVTNWDDKAVAKEYKKDTVAPQYTIEKFSDLRDIVKGSQLTLF